MLLSSPKARLITFSKTRLIKFYLNSQLITDPIYLFQSTHYVNETSHVVEKKVQPAKELLIWKPHANPVRNINTSTK